MIGIDMKMPKLCDECILADKIGQYFGCPVLNKAIPTGYKSPDCPLHYLDDEIRIGDEVLNTVNGWKYVVTRIDPCGDLSVLHCPSGRATCVSKSNVKCTGRHFDEVKALLKKMKGEEE